MMGDQNLLFAPEEVEPWRREWQDMPEFLQEDLTSIQSAPIHWASWSDLDDFNELVTSAWFYPPRCTCGAPPTCPSCGVTCEPREPRIDRPLTRTVRTFWYPDAEIGHFANKRYVRREA